MPQVRPEHYRTDEYNSVERFCSYAHQLKLIAGLDVKSILEVGPGTFLVSDALKRRGYDVTTCDFDAELGADVTADVRNLPFKDGTFDLVMACQVLEHLPVEDFESAAAEIARVCRRFILISLPRACAEYWCVFRLPFLWTVFGKRFYEWSVVIPRRFVGIKKHGQHYWEISRQTNLTFVRQQLSRVAHISKELSPILTKTHYFFLLEKR